MFASHICLTASSAAASASILSTSRPLSPRISDTLFIGASLAGSVSLVAPACRPRTRGSAHPSSLEPVFQLAERGPARVQLFVVVLVRRVVEVASANRAQPRAVLSAEDLVRKLEHERVARPRREIELVVRHVGRPELVRLRVLGLVLAARNLDVDNGVRETAVARTVQASPETQLENHPRLGTADHELALHLVRNRQVALTAERDRLERDLLLVSVLLPRPQAQRAQAEAGHGRRLARAAGAKAKPSALLLVRRLFVVGAGRADAGDHRLLRALMQPLAAPLHRSEELVEIDLERGEDRVGPVLHLEPGFPRLPAGVL